MRRSPVIRTLGLVLVAGLALTMGSRPPIHASPTPEFGGFGGGEDEPLENGPVVHLAAKPMSPEATRVWLALQRKLDMQFPNDTPLQDVVTYIRQATIDKADFPEGIPVYVEPQGLQDADKTMASTITIDLKGIPLATTLTLILKQLGLVYQIHRDGMLFITSPDSEEAPPDADALILDNLSALRAEVKALREEIRNLRGGVPEDHPKPPTNTSGLGGARGGMGGMM